MSCKKIIIFAFTAFLIFQCCHSFADIYSIRGDDGRIFFTDVPTAAGFKLLMRESEPIRPWREIAKSEAMKHGIDPLLVKALIRIESGNDPTAISPKGARGLMQLMPETAKELGVADIMTPQQNIKGGVKYFSDLLDKFEGRLDLALAAYNAGPGAIKNHGGVPPFPETINFVARVIDEYNQLKENKTVDTSQAIMHNHVP